MGENYNMRSPAVRRLMKEARELSEPTEQYFAQPLDDNLFEWHFTIRGPEDTEFEGGIYHGRIVLPPEYPMKPPNIYFFTNNGRFEVHKKICLSISGHHPESWQPSWSIRTALLAMIGFLPTPGVGAIGSLDYSKEERKKLARKSREFRCSVCNNVSALLKPVTSASVQEREEARQLGAQLKMEGEKQKVKSEDQNTASSSATDPSIDSTSESQDPTAPTSDSRTQPSFFSELPQSAAIPPVGGGQFGPACRMPPFPAPSGGRVRLPSPFMINMLQQRMQFLRGAPPIHPDVSSDFAARMRDLSLNFSTAPASTVRAGAPTAPLTSSAAAHTVAAAQPRPQHLAVQRQLRRNQKRVSWLIGVLLLILVLLFMRRAMQMLDEVLEELAQKHTEL